MSVCVFICFFTWFVRVCTGTVRDRNEPIGTHPFRMGYVGFLYRYFIQFIQSY